jgi:hypothetical protein
MLLQIVYPDGTVVRLPAGGPLEAEMVDLLTRTIMAKGVGLFRSEAHVEQDIRSGIRDALMGLKHQTRFVV